MSVDLFSCDCECGCAAKVPPDLLRNLLRDLNLPASPDLLVGPETLDDAGVYRISDEQYLVQTVDFFPPVARKPYVYGRIAAANSLSDVYAMGGTPITAMAICCFPMNRFSPDVLKQISAGAVERLREANAVLLGGHSIVDPQPKFGLAVTGTINGKDMMDNAHAVPGDALILTKPLGTGVTIMAAKGGIATEKQEQDANECMCALNADAAAIAGRHCVRSCTDITGFGLLGHALQLARASGVSLDIRANSIPTLDAALRFASMGLLSSAAYANRRYVGEAAAFGNSVERARQDLLFDPQTSGGLLLSVAHDKADALLDELAEALSTQCAIIGTVAGESKEAHITVEG